MNDMNKISLNCFNNEEIDIMLEFAYDVVTFCEMDSKDERIQYYGGLIEGPSLEIGQYFLIGNLFLCGTTLHKQFVAKFFALSLAEREELMEFFCDCQTDDDLMHSLYEYIDQHIEIIDRHAASLAQDVEIKEAIRLAKTRKPQLPQVYHEQMSMSFIPEYLNLTWAEQHIVMLASRPFFNAIQSNQSISTTEFLRFLAQMVDREESCGFERGCEAHLSLIGKLNALATHQMEQVFQFVMLSWHEYFGELSEMNMRFSEEKLKTILKPFHRMQQIALIHAAQSCKRFVAVGLQDLMECFSSSLYSSDCDFGGLIISESYEHKVLLRQYEALDESDKTTLALACTSFWVYPNKQKEKFAWVFNASFPMTEKKYVLSQCSKIYR
ncbi:hypothetical protein [uncultured Tolumonas sp.]|uniref:hypothetical protein n=1 Tax=uncultured Tolumonas sp. TaxID=263765 RepID=UPI002A0A6EB4|nr:hypothetical protein [uncultured Tolumonas sp.]